MFASAWSFFGLVSLIVLAMFCAARFDTSCSRLVIPLSTALEARRAAVSSPLTIWVRCELRAAVTCQAPSAPTTTTARTSAPTAARRPRDLVVRLTACVSWRRVRPDGTSHECELGYRDAHEGFHGVRAELGAAPTLNLE